MGNLISIILYQWDGITLSALIVSCFRKSIQGFKVEEVTEMGLIGLVDVTAIVRHGD